VVFVTAAGFIVRNHRRLVHHEATSTGAGCVNSRGEHGNASELVDMQPGRAERDNISRTALIDESLVQEPPPACMRTSGGTPRGEVMRCGRISGEHRRSRVWFPTETLLQVPG
jgi:hypothetical protein